MALPRTGQASCLGVALLVCDRVTLVLQCAVDELDELQRTAKGLSLVFSRLGNLSLPRGVPNISNLQHEGLSHVILPLPPAVSEGLPTVFLLVIFSVSFYTA